MNYTMERADRNTVVMTMEEGNTVTIHFRPEDNPDIENIVTDNLLTSYEERIKKLISNN